MNTSLRSFRTAAWLGWQVESNWTDPLLFFTFSILKPISSVLILVFMYNTVSQAGASAPIYSYIYIGNAFYIYVGAVMAGASYSILDDRERYRTLKYLYIAPIIMPLYLMGRAVARFVVGTMAVFITLLAGVIFFRVPIDVLHVNWALLAITIVLGLICLVGMGVLIGAWTMTIRNEPWFLGEAFAAALYIFSGAIFPITILPTWLQGIGFALPISYWLELIRRALLGAGAASFPTFAGFSDLQLLGILAAQTVFFIIAALFGFRFFDHVAREKGMIDVTSNF